MKSKLLATFGLTSLLSCSYLPDFDPNDALSQVNVRDTRSFIELSPKYGTVSATGFMFYPGGLVDSHSYNKMLAGLVIQGYKVLVVKFPDNLAVFNADAGLALRDKAAGVTKWVIGGHSLGGAMAASVVKRNPSAFSGIVFLGSYPADADSLKNWNGPVLSISATEDGLSTPVKITNSINNLPPVKWLKASDRTYPAVSGAYSVFHQIPGGCHAQFGSYGKQDGDGTPVITASEQHAETVDYLTEFFSKNGW